MELLKIITLQVFQFSNSKVQGYYKSILICPCSYLKSRCLSSLINKRKKKKKDTSTQSTRSHAPKEDSKVLPVP